MRWGATLCHWGNGVKYLSLLECTQLAQSCMISEVAAYSFRRYLEEQLEAQRRSLKASETSFMSIGSAEQNTNHTTRYANNMTEM